MGVNMARTPDASLKISGSEYIAGYTQTYPPYTYIPGYDVNVNAEASVSSVSQQVFVYGAIVEAILGEGITIGARYIACKPKYDLDIKVTATATAQGYTSSGTQSQKIQWEPNISLIQIYLGFAF
jgi:predicted component of type VI protein secretion system